MRNDGMNILVLLGILLLGGCSSLSSPNPDSPYYAYPPGWTVQFNRALPINPGSATVRLQYGQIVPRNGVQEQDPFCILEVNTVSNQAQWVQPGRFEILQVMRSVSEITAAGSLPINPGLMKTGMGGGYDTPSFLYYITLFRLRADAQPDVRSLRCAWNQMAPGNRSLMRHLTLDEMHQALGDWITLMPPAERL